MNDYMGEYSFPLFLSQFTVRLQTRRFPEIKILLNIYS